MIYSRTFAPRGESVSLLWIAMTVAMRAATTITSFAGPNVSRNARQRPRTAA